MNNSLKIQILFIIFITLPSGLYAANEATYLSYNEFIDKVKNQDIVTVELNNFSQISGKYKQGDDEISFNTYQADPNEDPLLLELLRNNNSEITLLEEKEDLYPFHSFFSVLIFLLPIISFILTLLIYIKIRHITKHSTGPANSAGQ
jgi:ATP-dependent Zn protease